MQNVARTQRLAELRTRIAAIEKRPLLAEAALRERHPAAADRQGPTLLAAPAGLLQEVHTDERRDASAALGFALGLARGLLTPERPALLFMQVLHEAQDTGLPYGPGLASFGLDPATLILGRVKTIPELLWAIEEAIACRAVAAVIAEIAGTPKALDFTASRRLSLRAASGGASVFLLRHGQDREASAARLRWRIAPASSQAPPFDDRAPGLPRWHAILEKARLGPGLMQADIELWLDWTKNGFQPLFRAAAAEPGQHEGGRAALPGVAPAALGDRLSQAG